MLAHAGYLLALLHRAHQRHRDSLLRFIVISPLRGRCTRGRRQCIGLRPGCGLQLSYPHDRWFVYKRLVPTEGQSQRIPLLNQEVNLGHLALKRCEDRSLTSLDRQEKAIRLSQFPCDLSFDGFSFFDPKRLVQKGTDHVGRDDRPNNAERNPDQQDEKDQSRLHDVPPSSRESLPATARHLRFYTLSSQINSTDTNRLLIAWPRIAGRRLRVRA